MPSPAERLEVLNEVNVYAIEELTDLWRGASGMPSEQFRQLLIDAVPEIVDPHAAMAADYSVDWYAQSDPQSPFRPTPAALPDALPLKESAAWALGATGDEALTRFAGFMQRAIFDTARDTMVSNVDREPGARWVRHARGKACAFCRMLATRSETRSSYTSESAALSVVGRGQQMSESDRRARARGESRIGGRFMAGGTKTRGSRPLGEKYHDYCRCTAVEVRPGMTYIPPPYTERWEQQYKAAVKDTASGGAINLNAVLAHMRQADPTAA